MSLSVKKKAPSWKLFTDGSSNECHAGAGVILITPEGHRFHCAIRFDFTASHNEAEYEALLVGLWLARDMNIKVLDIYSDSQLVVNQVMGEYQARGLKMVAYLKKQEIYWLSSTNTPSSKYLATRIQMLMLWPS